MSASRFLNPLLIVLGILMIVIGVAAGHVFADITGVVALAVAAGRWGLGLTGRPTR